MITFPPWTPDGSPFDQTITRSVTNVLPRPGLPPDPAKSPPFGGWAPFPGITAITSAVAAQPRGCFMARADSGVAYVFVGTATKLYLHNPATASFDDVSEPSVVYALTSSEIWSFVQFGQAVIATNKVDGPQVFTLGSSTTFAALAGAPPVARIAGTIGDFVFLGETSQSREIRWSGINDHTYWEIGAKLSDHQIFPDGSDITGFVGWEDSGLVFQRRGVREVIARLDTDLIFQFRGQGEGHGCISPGSLIKVGRRVFYLAETGFHEYGQPPRPIGADRVDRTFFADINSDDLLLVQGDADPRGNRVFWRYRSSSAPATTYTDKMLCYDYVLDRWSLININLSWVFGSTSGGYTLETLDDLLLALGVTLETFGLSLDDPSLTSSVPVIAGMTSDYKLGIFGGDNLEATMETANTQISPNRRTFVRGFRPICDTTNVYGRIITKATPGADTVTGTEAIASTSDGVVPVRGSGLFHRFKIRIPAATTWTYAHGVDIDGRPEGRR